MMSGILTDNQEMKIKNRWKQAKMTSMRFMESDQSKMKESDFLALSESEAAESNNG